LANGGKCFFCKVDELWCGDECKGISGTWMCNGKCQSVNLPCNGTCSGFIEDELFWKCPFETNKCISNYLLCNRIDKGYSSDLKCENNIQKSRLVCDNPNKFDVILNCTGRNSVQCPGNKTQQCIFGSEICDETINCVDRYSILYVIILR
jgi:hypothetical protein